MASLEQDIEWERQQKQELVLEKERAIAEIKYVQIQVGNVTSTVMSYG